MPTGIVETKDDLLKTSKSLEEVKKATAKINTDLQEVKKDLEQALSDPACSLPPQDKCKDIRATLGQLDNSTNPARVRGGPLLAGQRLRGGGRGGARVPLVGAWAGPPRLPGEPAATPRWPRPREGGTGDPSWRAVCH